MASGRTWSEDAASGEKSSVVEDDWTQEDIPNDVEVLKRVWRNEKAAPEILGYETLLVGRVREQLTLMVQNFIPVIAPGRYICIRASKLSRDGFYKGLGHTYIPSEALDAIVIAKALKGFQA